MKIQKPSNCPRTCSLKQCEEVEIPPRQCSPNLRTLAEIYLQPFKLVISLASLLPHALGMLDGHISSTSAGSIFAGRPVTSRSTQYTLWMLLAGTCLHFSVPARGFASNFTRVCASIPPVPRMTDPPNALLLLVVAEVRSANLNLTRAGSGRPLPLRIATCILSSLAKPTASPNTTPNDIPRRACRTSTKQLQPATQLQPLRSHCKALM